MERTISEPLAQSALAEKCKSAPAVFLSLLAMRRPDNSIWSSRGELSARTGLNGHTVGTAIHALVEGNWIRNNPDSWNHGYFLNPLVLTRLGLLDRRVDHE